MTQHGRYLPRCTFLALRQIARHGRVVVVHIVVIDIIAAIGFERVVTIIVVRRAQPGTKSNQKSINDFIPIDKNTRKIDKKQL